jgi:protoporphyrinogen oxidase
MGGAVHELLILGGGIAGLAAAHTAREAGIEATILEAAPRAGGILDSFEIDGFRFDNGVHLSFASEPEVRAVFDQTPYLEHDAVSYCWDNGIWLRHPTQNNMFPLPVEERIGLIEGLVRQPVGEIANYRDWLVQQYGLPIAARWPLIYTNKYWTVPAERLGTDWIGRRMRRADLGEVLRGALCERAPNTYYIQRMRYPVRGGYRAFIEPLERTARVLCDMRVVAVDPGRRVVISASGASFTYRALISTLPLPDLVATLPDVPDSIRADAATLFATRADLVSVALRRSEVAPSLWMYVYDRDLLASRIYVPGRKSPNNVPPGCSSLQFEIYSSVHRPCTASPDELVENCLLGMERMGLACREEVLFTHVKTLPYANVVFDLGMETRRDRVRAWVGQRGIGLAGRYGEWAYLWSNQSFLSGRAAALAALSGRPG